MIPFFFFDSPQWSIRLCTGIPSAAAKDHHNADAAEHSSGDRHRPTAASVLHARALLCPSEVRSGPAYRGSGYPAPHGTPDASPRQGGYPTKPRQRSHDASPHLTSAPGSSVPHRHRKSNGEYPSPNDNALVCCPLLLASGDLNRGNRGLPHAGNPSGSMSSTSSQAAQSDHKSAKSSLDRSRSPPPR